MQVIVDQKCGLQNIIDPEAMDTFQGRIQGGAHFGHLREVSACKNTTA